MKPFFKLLILALLYMGCVWSAVCAQDMDTSIGNEAPVPGINEMRGQTSGNGLMIAGRSKRLRGDPKRGFTNSFGMAFALIPKGSFVMGRPQTEPGRGDDETQHRVTLTRPFYLQTTEVTQVQWEAIMGDNPSMNKSCGADCPVEAVSWNDVQEFILRLNRLDKTSRYRLPTESEWEWACRSGTKTAFSFGKCLYSKNSNYDHRYPLTGCTGGKFRARTIPVASLSTNAWGLYDMHGNVAEWCQDHYGKYPMNPITDPQGPSLGKFRIYRGGSCMDTAVMCRSSVRSKDIPELLSAYLGFRLVREPEP